MSKIALKPNASGTGVFSLEAPDSNTDRTLTLPDEEGTVATIENIPPGYEDQDALDLFNVTGSAPVYACRAWVNFDGENTTIRESGNVSSVTDRGQGQFTINFNNSMPDDEYSLVGSVRGQDGRLDESPCNFGTDFFTNAGAECSVTRNKRGSSESDGFFDSSLVNAAVFR